MAPAPPQKTSGLAIAAFILSLIFFLPGASFLGAVLGGLALWQISKNPSRKGNGLAIAAVIVGLLVSLIQLFIFFILPPMVAMMGTTLKATSLPLGEGIALCDSLKAGFERENCVMSLISVHPTELGKLDPNFCEGRVTQRDQLGLCNALVRRDPSYCEKIDLLQRPNCRMYATLAAAPETPSDEEMHDYLLGNSS